MSNHRNISFDSSHLPYEIDLDFTEIEAAARMRASNPAPKTAAVVESVSRADFVDLCARLVLFSRHLGRIERQVRERVAMYEQGRG